LDHVVFPPEHQKPDVFSEKEINGLNNEYIEVM